VREQLWEIMRWGLNTMHNKIVFTILSFFILCSVGWANVTCDGTNDHTKVQSAITALGGGGGTVTIDAGTCTFSGTITINGIPVVIQGSGTKGTTINHSGSDNVFIITGTQDHSRITNFVVNTTGTHCVKVTGGTDWRVDHITHTGPINASQFVATDGFNGGGLNYYPSGLVDNNITNNYVFSGGGLPSTHAEVGIGPGTSSALFVENNTFNISGSTMVVHDGSHSNRTIFRHNTLNLLSGAHPYASGFLQHSEQCTDVIYRGARWWEIYSNKWYSVDGNGARTLDLLSGTGRVYGNAFIGYSSLIVEIGNDRSEDATFNAYWCKSCDGVSGSPTGFDGNESGLDGYLCRDQIGAGVDAFAWVYPAATWPSQTKQPAYFWDNYSYPNTTAYNAGRGSGTAVNLTVRNVGRTTTHIVLNRDYYNTSNAYTIYTCPHPLVTELSGTTCDQTLSGAGTAGGYGIDDDTTAPTITAFDIPATSSSLTVPISSFTCTDAVGVTGYCMTETNDSGTCAWFGSAQGNYIFGSQGAKTLYAFCRDAALNISTVASDTTTITLPASGVTYAPWRTN